MRRQTPLYILVLFLALLAGLPSTQAPAVLAASRFPAVTECEGGACSHVTMTFDESKEQYRVQNNSADRWVKVAASNVAAFASVCVGPGKAEHLPLKSILGAYRAEYAETGCAPPGE